MKDQLRKMQLIIIRLEVSTKLIYSSQSSIQIKLRGKLHSGLRQNKIANITKKQIHRTLPISIAPLNSRFTIPYITQTIAINDESI